MRPRKNDIIKCVRSSDYPYQEKPPKANQYDYLEKADSFRKFQSMDRPECWTGTYFQYKKLERMLDAAVGTNYDEFYSKIRGLVSDNTAWEHVRKHLLSWVKSADSTEPRSYWHEYFVDDNGNLQRTHPRSNRAGWTKPAKLIHVDKRQKTPKFYYVGNDGLWRDCNVIRVYEYGYTLPADLPCYIPFDIALNVRPSSWWTLTQQYGIYSDGVGLHRYTYATVSSTFMSKRDMKRRGLVNEPHINI